MLAAEQGIRFAPHASIGTFHAASLHGAASLPDIALHEYQHSVLDANLRFRATRMRCAAGFFELPVGPGLGAEPKADLWQHIVRA